MNTARRIRKANQKLQQKREQLDSACESLHYANISAPAIYGTLAGSFVLGFVLQRVITHPRKTLMYCARLFFSPWSLTRLF